MVAWTGNKGNNGWGSYLMVASVKPIALLYEDTLEAVIPLNLWLKS